MAQTPSRRGVLSLAGLLPLAIVPATKTSEIHHEPPPPGAAPRHLLGAGAALAFLAPAAIDTARAAPEAELIQLCDRLARARAVHAHLVCGPGAPCEPDTDPVTGPQIAALNALEDELLLRIEGIGVHTLAGAEAMARAGLMLVERYADGQPVRHGRDWPGTAAAEWLAGREFCQWAATHPRYRTKGVPPPVRRART